MKVIVTYDDHKGKHEMTLTDEHLDNDAFVDLIVGDTEITVSIDELHRAMLPFVQKYHEWKEELSR